MENAGVYIHIPFCRKKCLYCDFPSYSGMEEMFSAYKNALLKEIKAAAQLHNYSVGTIFIGGGTPTVLPECFIGEIMEALSLFSINGDAEITIEANPGTLSAGILKSIRHYGINRLSMGLQSSHNRILKALGRIHSYEDFLRNYEDAIAVGFCNINVDLMFGLPGQRLEGFEQTLEEVTSLDPAHISAYSLIVEESTPFSKMAENGLLDLPNEDTERLMYHSAKKFLAQKGYSQYEISNFSYPGYESRHNIGYWTLKNYFGFGLSAHSYVSGVRYSNTQDMDSYINSKGDLGRVRADSHTLSQQEKMEEFMFLGLRMTEGVDPALFKQFFRRELKHVYSAAIKKNTEAGLLWWEAGKLRLTSKGIDISNMVMSDFLL